MAIVMVTSFHPLDLPGLDPSRLYPLSDVSSYEQIWAAVQSVFHQCLVGRKTGWIAVGMQLLTLQLV